MPSSLGATTPAASRQIVIALYDRFTALDAVGPHQVLHHLPGTEVIFAAQRAGGISDEGGTLTLEAPASFADVPHPDIIVIPGGPGQADQMTPGPLLDWLVAADATSTWTTSVCTGALILGAAGLLRGRAATTYWLALDELPRYGAIPRRERFVFDGKYLTGAGVSAGIDMALALAGQVAGDAVAERIQLGIEYDPQPPYTAGSPATAPAAAVESFTRRSRFAVQ